MLIYSFVSKLYLLSWTPQIHGLLRLYIVQNVFLEDELLSARTGLSRHGSSALLSQCVTGLFKSLKKIRIVFLQRFHLCFVARFKFSEVKVIGFYVILQELWSDPYCPFVCPKLICVVCFLHISKCFLTIFTGDFILFSFVVAVGIQQIRKMYFVGGYLK